MRRRAVDAGAAPALPGGALADGRGPVAALPGRRARHAAPPRCAAFRGPRLRIKFGFSFRFQTVRVHAPRNLKWGQGPAAFCFSCFENLD